ncbi:MAG: hypothetical protein WCC87_01175 [Candidatus Korobacteraceae bacterium]
MVHSTGKLSVVLLLVVVCSTAMLTAQTSGAMLYATGNVTLNGAAVSDSSSIFAGDRLVTADSSIVSVNRSGSSVVVSPNSTVQYDKSAVEVLQGTAHVSTINGMSAEVGQVTVAPQDQSAKFDVVRTDNQVTVTSREGTVTVDDGGRKVLLQPGDHTTLALGASSSQSSFPTQGGAFVGKTEPSSLVASGPFYTIVSSPNDLPWCQDLTTCIRPNVSQIRPCKCPPPPGH